MEPTQPTHDWLQYAQDWLQYAPPPAYTTPVPSLWIRTPIGKATCPYTHLRHAKFYDTFVNNPRIRQCRLGKGKQRGTRLVYLPDVFRELDRLAAEQGTPGSNTSFACEEAHCPGQDKTMSARPANPSRTRE